MPKENPFYYNLPTHPEDFIGRRALVDGVISDLCSAHADSWAVIGGRRFGKSSVLKTIEAKLTDRLTKCHEGDLWVFPFLLDLKRCRPNSEEHIYACILHYLDRALRRSSMQMDELTMTDQLASVGAGQDTLSFFRFEEVLENLARRFSNQLGLSRFVLLLDEMESMIDFDWSDTLFNQLRAMIYDGPLANMVKLVLTGSANVIRARQAGSPLLNAVKIEHLPLLTENDLESLIKRGGEMPADAAEIVKLQSGGHPFVAQYLLHHAWNDGLARTSPQTMERISCHLRQNRSADMEGWWNAIGDSGQWAYAFLTMAQDWVNERGLLEEVQLADQSLDQGLSALCYHGLVRRDESLRHYRVAGELFNDWFMLNGAKRLVEAESQPRDAQIIIEHLENIGAQTNIAGNVDGSVASGKFESAAAVGDGKAVDQRGEEDNNA